MGRFLDAWTDEAARKIAEFKEKVLLGLCCNLWDCSTDVLEKAKNHQLAIVRNCENEDKEFVVIDGVCYGFFSQTFNQSTNTMNFNFEPYHPPKKM